jgi:hypothetical protein
MPLNGSDAQRPMPNHTGKASPMLLRFLMETTKESHFTGLQGKAPASDGMLCSRL